MLAGGPPSPKAYSRIVQFRLPEGDNCINVMALSFKRDLKGPLFVITLSPAKAGKGCYLIDDDGPYLRWHVVMKALEPLFFDETELE